jgi:uncharacterized membrane protein
MTEPLSTKWLLIGVAVVATVSFILKANNKILSKNHDHYVVVLLMQIIAAIIMSFIVLYKPGYRTLSKEIKSMKANHFFYILFGGIASLGLFLISMRLLETHDISHLGILDTGFDALIAVMGGYLIFSEKVTLMKIIGAITILLGIYFTHL